MRCPSCGSEHVKAIPVTSTITKTDQKGFDGCNAFGFIMDDKTQWATAVNPNNWYGNVKYPFGTINSNGQAQLHLKGKYGLNWGNALAKKITYDVVYKVEVVE